MHEDLEENQLSLYHVPNLHVCILISVGKMICFFSNSQQNISYLIDAALRR